VNRDYGEGFYKFYPPVTAWFTLNRCGNSKISAHNLVNIFFNELRIMGILYEEISKKLTEN
jgi:hypothetical protein